MLRFFFFLLSRRQSPGRLIISSFSAAKVKLRRECRFNSPTWNGVIISVSYYICKIYLSYPQHLNCLNDVFTCFKLLSNSILPPNSPHSHYHTEFQNGTSVPTPNLISLKPASFENTKISASLFLSHPALMSLENCSSVAKRQATRKYFGCVSS